ncbi:MAG: hypothetical protein ACXVII_23235 [Solirubrobacteraceae bacterium]
MYARGTGTGPLPGARFPSASDSQRGPGSRDCYDETQKRRPADLLLPDRLEDAAALVIGRARGDLLCRSDEHLVAARDGLPLRGQQGARGSGAGRDLRPGRRVALSAHSGCERRNGRGPALEKRGSPDLSSSDELRVPAFVKLQVSGRDADDDRGADDATKLDFGE